MKTPRLRAHLEFVKRENQGEVLYNWLDKQTTDILFFLLYRYRNNESRWSKVSGSIKRRCINATATQRPVTRRRSLAEDFLQKQGWHDVQLWKQNKLFHYMWYAGLKWDSEKEEWIEKWIATDSVMGWW